MRQPFSGEIAKLALVAIASVATIGLFMFLALKEPGRRVEKSAIAPGPVAPSLELRHEAGEPPELEPEPPPRENPVEEAPRLHPQLQDAPRPDFETDESLTQPAPVTEKAPALVRSASLPKLKHRPQKVDVEPRASRNRAPFSGIVRSPASFRALPNKKCGVREGDSSESPLDDPFSEFIGAF